MSVPPTPAAPADPELPAPPGRLRGLLARHPRVVDVTWALIYAVSMAGALLPVDAAMRARLGTPAAQVAYVAMFLLGAGLSVAIGTVRRSRPEVVAAGAVATCLLGGAFYPGVDGLGGAIALYALAVHRSARSAWRMLAVLGGAAVASVLVALGTGASGAQGTWSVSMTGGAVRETDVNAVVVTFLVEVLVTALAVNHGNRLRYVRAVRERAEALARERDGVEALAVARERSRIAREMHDVVSHSLTVIVTLSDGAATQVDRSPERARVAMELASATAREAVSEMRRMLGVLREAGPPEAPYTPGPGAGDLPALCERFVALGLPVRLETDGPMPGDPGVQAAVHRIVGEGLTNAVRYAAGARQVLVQVACGPEELSVRVSDDGRGGAPGQGAGVGLIGVAERVAVYSGSLQAGPRPGGGWTLSATLRPPPDAEGRLPDAGSRLPGTEGRLPGAPVADDGAGVTDGGSDGADGRAAEANSGAAGVEPAGTMTPPGQVGGRSDRRTASDGGSRDRDEEEVGR